MRDKSEKMRRTHPQTVNNELIKDPRFVLIGRGLYALSEWGYEPGTVKDVLVQILKDSGKALRKEDVLQLISERRCGRKHAAASPAVRIACCDTTDSSWPWR